jgi:ankyrin repeat protein
MKYQALLAASTLAFGFIGCSESKPTAPVATDAHRQAAPSAHAVMKNDRAQALHTAIAQKDAARVKALLDDGVNVEVESPEMKQFTPLMAAAQIGATDIVKLLLEKKALPSAIAENGATALFFAAYAGKEGTVKALLDGGAQATAKDARGNRPVDLAHTKGHATIVDVLKAKMVAEEAFAQAQVLASETEIAAFKKANDAYLAAAAKLKQD